MTVSYVKKISSGHQYIVSLFPTSCNLNEEFVKAFFRLSTLAENNFVFSKEITKTSNNTYLLTIKTLSTLMDPVSMEASLEHLSDNLTVPKTFGPSLNDSDSSNGSLPLTCQEGEIIDTECKGIFIFYILFYLLISQ